MPGFDADQDIDVVVLWVDGSDPVLTAKRERYLKEEGITHSHSAALPTRYASNNEIRYCVLSILTFAPFVRNIFLVTDGQDPDLYEDIRSHFPERLNSFKIVDHKEIFEGFEEFLPTFNSMSIEYMIWRIKGLSENFIYFNDDVFLVRETGPSDWFVGNRPVLRGRWKFPPYRKKAGHFIKRGIHRKILGNSDYHPRISFLLQQWKAAYLLGMRFRYYFLDHTPHPMNRKRLEAFFDDHPEVLKKNISYRFRSRDQFQITALAYHLEIREGNHHLAPLNLTYLHPYYSAKRLLKKLAVSKQNERIGSICVQSLEMIDREVGDEVLGWMEQILMIEHDKKERLK
ncbi:MAG: Stealth CR1 domain-containing protein [Bacteroidota bacterium]